MKRSSPSSVKKKLVAVFFFKKKRATAPASSADPNNFFSIFGSACAMNPYVYRSEVNIFKNIIYRVMTRNESAVFPQAEETTLPDGV
jgi:hypothetical protein